MSRNTEQEARNKAFVLEAFEALFNRRDYVAAEKYWSPDYIQHSAHIPPGREGLFALIKGLPRTMRYENALTVGDADYVMLHGRFPASACPPLGSSSNRTTRRRSSRRALGRGRGRSHGGAVEEQTPDFRKQLSRLSARSVSARGHTIPRDPS